jgi:hypothetical protein
VSEESWTILIVGGALLLALLEINRRIGELLVIARRLQDR